MENIENKSVSPETPSHLHLPDPPGPPSAIINPSLTK